MLTDPKLRSQVDALWDKFWTGGLSNPLDAIEQFSYLLFLKRLDDARERSASGRPSAAGQPYQPAVPAEMRWGHWTQARGRRGAAAISRRRSSPGSRTLGEAGSSFERYMENAECKINKPSLLIEACKLIDQMQISPAEPGRAGRPVRVPARAS